MHFILLYMYTDGRVKLVYFTQHSTFTYFFVSCWEYLKSNIWAIFQVYNSFTIGTIWSINLLKSLLLCNRNFVSFDQHLPNAAFCRLQKSPFHSVSMISTLFFDFIYRHFQLYPQEKISREKCPVSLMIVFFPTYSYLYSWQKILIRISYVIFMC